MGIPVKALRESSFGENRQRMGEGSHQIWRVNFAENGLVKSGFFKKLEPNGHFPELLAKMSVATSAIKRLFQDKSAEERLVFDAEDNIVGILSIGLKDFKAFNFAYEEKPTNTIEKEKVIPSTETLIEKNMMEFLLGRWFLGDDDAHPHNMSLEGDIDFDMFWYWFVIFMKGGRPVVEVPKKRVDLTVRDYERFPCIMDAKPFHWPTFQHPGQDSITSGLPEMVQKPILSATARSMLPKVYTDPDQFARLAADPVAQQQKVGAALKVLLTFEPELLRKRLTDLFGTLTLNFTSLPPLVREKYEQEFPFLCNEKTNKDSFVNFMMEMYQQHYDNLYRVAVFYMGCADNGFGVPLLPTNEALYVKPSMYKATVAWATKQNETTYASESESKYNLDELKKRYHQIWRDSYTLRLKEMVRASRNLRFEISKLATASVKMDELDSKEITDDSLTSAWQVLGAMTDLSIDEKICVDSSSPLHHAYILLTNFTNDFQHVVSAYYEKERQELTDEDNRVFAIKLDELCNKYNVDIREALAHTTTHAGKFGRIITDLKQLAVQVNFQVHLLTTDDQMVDVKTSIKKDLLPIDHPEVINHYSEMLFRWADGQTREKFNQYIEESIKKYAPTIELLSTRKRGPPVKEYLRNSMESNSNKLAYILCSGKSEGALNTCIIRELTPMMLQTNYVPSVTHATKGGSFEANIGLFVKGAIGFATDNNNNNMVHLYNPAGAYLFFKTMYQWFGEQPVDKINRIVNKAIDNYEKGLSWTKMAVWGNTSRRFEIKECFRKYLTEPKKALALTFMKGGVTSTANEQLFLEIINEIKKTIHDQTELKKDPGYNLIDQYSVIENNAYYLPLLSCCTATVEMTHSKEKADHSITCV